MVLLKARRFSLREANVVRSMHAKLIVAFIGLAVLTTVLTAIFASYQAHVIFRQYVERNADRAPGADGSRDGAKRRGLSPPWHVVIIRDYDRVRIIRIADHGGCDRMRYLSGHGEIDAGGLTRGQRSPDRGTDILNS